MDDLISRKSALDALGEEPEVWVGADDEVAARGQWRIDKAAIEALPAAESIGELIRCKDCKFTDGDGPIADGRYWCVLHESFMYFCSDAERRTDG